MCGIAGVFTPDRRSSSWHSFIGDMTSALEKRGPDHQGIFQETGISLGHRRLSIIDTSAASHQPMCDASGNLVIVFNGEIFNYRELRKDLEAGGTSFRTDSDTEVLLELFRQKGKDCLPLLNGFFAFAIYDRSRHQLFLARDRFGVKPLSFLEQDGQLAFASETKSLVKLPVEKRINRASLNHYLHLNYLPPSASMLEGFSKVPPGHFLNYPAEKEAKPWYSLAKEITNQTPSSYPDACSEFEGLLRDAVKIRLRSDVPLGSFLSGGIDSSVVSALARQENGSLQTFSIGFEDEPAFDETRYAEMLARKWNTQHTAFRLKKDDLFNHLHEVLDYFDEPFADSSALAVYILSKQVRTCVTVALSGDGADEMLGGYNKHEAELRIQQSALIRNFAGLGKPVLEFLPKSRNSRSGNLIRKLYKLSRIASLNPKERYWQSAGFYHDAAPHTMFRNALSPSEIGQIEKEKSELLQYISDLAPDMSQVMLSDMQLVLPGDMLVKVDRMSMANSLEVRNPFLDYRVVHHVMRQPAHYRIDKHARKKMLIDSFGKLLPSELLNRNKMGFEVPLLHWFRTDLRSLIEEDLLSEKFISEQALFQYAPIERLIRKLHSSDPDDSVARIWGLMVFQYWWKKHFKA
jgi:asparagine synthase (glutamine-hydrolysing)